ncbi:unnamed protein product, partial [Staurois parvus]
MQGPGRADIVNAGSGETGYSECRVRGACCAPSSRVGSSNTGGVFTGQTIGCKQRGKKRPNA